MYGKIAYLITNFSPIDSAPRKSVQAVLPESSLRDNFNELMNAAGVNDDTQALINNVEEFVSGLFSSAVSSMATNTDECQGNSTILMTTYTNLRDQVSNENYTAAAASLQ